MIKGRGEEVKGGRRRRGRRVVLLHALMSVLDGRSQLAVTVRPAAFVEFTHSEKIIVSHPGVTDVLQADAVLLGQFLFMSSTL